MKDAFARYGLLIKNSAFNLGGQGVSILAALVCVPITFRQLGTERFGLLTLVWSLLAYATLFDLGTGPAVARASAASLVQDEGRRVRAILRAGVALQLILGVVTAFVIAILTSTLVRVLRVPLEFQADATRALYVLAAVIPLLLIMQSQQAVLEALERFDLLAYVRTPVAVATYAFPAIGALAGWSLATIMGALFATRLLAIPVTHALYRNKLPNTSEGSIRHELPGLFRFSRWIAMSGALTQMVIYADRFLLSSMHGLTAVAQYAAPYDAASKLLHLPGSIGLALFPGLAKDVARAQGDEAVVRSRASARITMTLLLPLALLLFIFAGPILRFWLGPTLSAEGISAFRILLIATIFHAGAYAPVILIEAFGRPDVVARYLLVELGAYLPIAAFAIARFGVVGAAWAWVARSAAFMIWSLWYTRRWKFRGKAVVARDYAHAD